MKEIKAIASKSDAHRALICAALCKTECKVRIDTTSKDIEATEQCLKNIKTGKKEMYCKESGSTFRFLLPVVAALGMEAWFYPEGRLPMRPLSPLYEEMKRHGCTLSKQGEVPFIVKGKLCPGTYYISGNVSSQFISGLLFALPLLKDDSFVCIDGTIQSEGYINMTIGTLKKFGISIEKKKDGYFVKGNQSYISCGAYKVEGDWSNAAFFLVAGALLEEGIKVTGLSMDSFQGDKEIVSILKQAGAKVMIEEDSVTVRKGKIKGMELDVSQIPDMVPALAVLFSAAEGKTHIYNAGRLRMKESDRLHAVTSVINSLGGKILEEPEGLMIEGTELLKGGEISSYNDHRIAMMASIASLISKDIVTIYQADAVNKSYPDFYKDMAKLKLDGKIERK